MVKVPNKKGLAFELVPIQDPRFEKVDAIISKL